MNKMNSHYVLGLRSFMICALVSGSVSCASRFLQFENSEKVLENKEFDQVLQVKEVATVEPTPTPSPPAPVSEKVEEKMISTVRLKRAGSLKTKAKDAKKPELSKPREPRFEDSEGFNGRRPIVDPFNIGEEVVLDISYFGVDAGELTMQVRPFVEVNGRRAYRFHSIARTVSVFEVFYKVDDHAETLVDFETLLPYSYMLNVKETKLLRNARALHNWQTGRMHFWDKKITKESGVEEKKLDWEMPNYSQNIFSALWYLRVFQLKPGKNIQFRMSHENENLLINCEVLRREMLNTAIGVIPTVVIRPSAEKDGQKKNIGDNLFWLTDDTNKIMVRMESRIKLGTIVGSLNRLKRM
jgi:hypothetical protein